MAKMLTIVNFKDVDLAMKAARNAGIMVVIGDKIWWDKDDKANKVTIYTKSPKTEYARFFEAFAELLEAPAVENDGTFQTNIGPR